MMRKVDCFKYKNREEKRVFYKAGLFHQWGLTFEEFETGGVSATVAVVEFEDGTVETFIPEMVTFLAGEANNDRETRTTNIGTGLERTL